MPDPLASSEDPWRSIPVQPDFDDKSAQKLGNFPLASLVALLIAARQLAIPHLWFIATGYAVTVVAQLIAIAWCFRVRRALRAYTLTQHNFELRMNRLYSVLFGFCHINYCINDMARAKHKHDQKRQTPQGPVTA